MFWIHDSMLSETQLQRSFCRLAQPLFLIPVCILSVQPLLTPCLTLHSFSSWYNMGLALYLEYNSSPNPNSAQGPCPAQDPQGSKKPHLDHLESLFYFLLMGQNVSRCQQNLSDPQIFDLAISQDKTERILYWLIFSSTIPPPSS